MPLSLLSSFAAGILYVLAFAPYHSFIAFIASIAIFYIVIRHRYDFKHAFSFAFAMNLFGVSWVYQSIHTYGNQNQALSILFTLGFILFLSAYFAGFFCLARLKHFNRLRQYSPYFFFALIWISFEWLKTTPLLPFPWLQASYALTSSPLKALLPVTGLLGASFVSVLLIAACADALNLGQRGRALGLSIAATIMAFVLQQIEWTTPKQHMTTITAIQGNYTEFEKWDPNNLQEILQYYSSETMAHLDSDVVIWPEGALPMPWQEGAPLLAPLFEITQKNKRHLILGAPYAADDNRYYNSLLVIANKTQQYHKQNLVYFGESLPFDPILRPLLQSMNVPEPIYVKPKLEIEALRLQDYKLAPAICFDIAFSRTLHHFFPAANLIVMISDDAWFGTSIAGAQHLQISQAQSLVYGRPQVTLNNNGLTSFINSKGEVTAQLPFNVRSSLTQSLYPYTGITPAMYINEATLLGVLWLCLIIFHGLIARLFNSKDMFLTNFGLLKRR